MAGDSSSPLTRYAWLSVAAAMVTLILKLTAWRMTGSVGMLSDALESLANLAAAFITLASLVVSARPADREHAYGHTKVEYFAGGIEGVLILAAACGIGWSAVHRLLTPHPLEAVPFGLAVLAVAAAVNFAVARRLFRVGRQHHSVALEADARHLLTDVWTSLAVIAGVALVAVTGWHRLDPVLGLALATHIVFTGAKLVHQSMLGLMDTGLPSAEMAAIRAALESFRSDGVNYHALRTRQAGVRRFMSVHLLVPGDWTVARAHQLAEIVEDRIRQTVPRLTVLTHIEPAEDPASWQDVGLDRADRLPVND
jgi:cation diffusion facilitator family transporter